MIIFVANWESDITSSGRVWEIWNSRLKTPPEWCYLVLFWLPIEVPVKLLFQPDKPINYYRRLFLLVEHRMPLFVDLLGTAFVPARGEVKEQRPAPLRHAHLQASRNRVAAGLGQASPDELEELFRELRDRGPTPEERLLFARVGARGHDDVLLKTSTAAPMTRSGESTRGDIAVAHDLYFEHEGADPDKEVQISHDSLDFGCQTVGSSADRKRTVTVTNTGNMIGDEVVQVQCAERGARSAERQSDGLRSGFGQQA